MWFISRALIELLFVAVLAFESSICSVVKCKFEENIVWHNYCCEVTEWWNATYNGRISLIEGSHIEGMFNDDVECLWIENLRTINHFTNDFFLKFKNLHNLVIQSTSLKHLMRGDFILANQLMNVYIRHNPITNLEDYCFYGAHIEETLNLRQNKIRKIAENAFSGLTSLKFLILSFNKIEFLHTNTFSDLSSLKELSLSDNKIRHVHEKLFSKNRHLEVLFLSNNQLKVMNGNAFEYNQRLKNIYIDNNEIEQIKNIENFLVNLEDIETFLFTNNTCASVQIHVYHHAYPPYNHILANCTVKWKEIKNLIFNLHTNFLVDSLN